MTSVSTIDSRTADAIREAVAAASAGRTNDAYEIATAALANGGEAATLNAFLGSLHIRGGDLEAGIRFLRQANLARPTDPVIAFNLASALAQRQEYEAALEVIPKRLAEADSTMRLERLRGFLAQSVERFSDAVASYEAILAAAPDDWETWNNLGNARRAVGDAPGALQALRRAVEINPDTAPVRFNYATALVWAEETEKAEAEIRAMAADFPDDWRPLRELHALLRLQGREEEATEALEEAVRRDPANVELLLGLAAHLLSRLQHAAAEEAYGRVLEIEGGNTLAYLGLATVLDLTNRTSELTDLVAQAEQANVHTDGLRFIRAYDHRRAKRYAEGLEELLQVPDELETARRQHLLGQLLEGTGDYDGAFAAFERMNAISREDPSQPEQRGATYRKLIATQRDALSPEWANSWRDGEVDERPSPVFLVGFPRSGTTLLDTILLSHPSIEVLEEEPTLVQAAELLGGFEGVAQAPPEKSRQARDAYFETARALTPLEPGNLLIDKNPLAMNSVPMIRRLFPESRIILAVRHPCDVVLSCFVTNFKPNNGMVSFLQLKTAAELYDLSFSYFERACELLKPAVHTVVYENIVADRGRELRPLFQFLGLPWDERVLDHQTTARSRGHIKTASYAQVVEPIYTRSSGRWLNYRKHLEPILPILRPWAEKFGYEI
jgi:tetratricopeptide (TPR) repeat protein